MRVLLLMLVFIPGLSHGAKLTASEVVNKCAVLEVPAAQRTKEQSQDLGFCLGYIAGLTDADRTFSEWKAKDEYICLQGREDATLENMAKLLTKELQAYPQDGTGESSNYMLNTIWRNFSCGF